MDFIDRVREMAVRIEKRLAHVQSEEATKTSLVMPFINHVLGYNVFDPAEVTPEFSADVGTKKGERVDYAILKDGKPIMLFECKRYGSDLDKEEADVSAQEVAEEEEEEGGIVTTEQEFQGYYIVKAILREVIDPKRVSMRDQKSYCGILLDNSNRKPICRLHFNTPRKHLGLFDEHKHEERVRIEDVDDIFRYAERLKATPSFYEEG